MITVDGGGKNFQSTFSAYKYKGAWGSWPRFSKVTIWSISSILNDLNKICRGGVIEHVGTHTGEIPADAWFCNSNSAWLFISILTKITGLEKYEDTNENNNNKKKFLKIALKNIKDTKRLQISNDYFLFRKYFWLRQELRVSLCPSVCLSVRLSVRPSVRGHFGFRAITRKIFFKSFWNLVGTLIGVISRTSSNMGIAPH